MVGKPDSLGFTRKPPPSTFNYRWDTAGYHRDTFYEVRRAFQVGGTAALVEQRRDTAKPWD